MPNKILTQQALENKTLLQNSLATQNEEHVVSVLFKLKALLDLGLNCEAVNKQQNLHGYLWCVSDLLAELEKTML